MNTENNQPSLRLITATTDNGQEGVMISPALPVKKTRRNLKKIGIERHRLLYAMQQLKKMKKNSMIPELTTEQFFELFRISYPSANVMVYDDMLVYKVGGSLAPHACKCAKKLIDANNWPLEAIWPKGFPDVMQIVSIL